MRILTTTLLAITLFSFSHAQSVPMTWDIFAENPPEIINIKLISEGKIMNTIDQHLNGNNSIELMMPMDTRTLMLVTTEFHKPRQVIIDTHYALDNKKQAKQNRKFAYDLYLEAPDEEIKTEFLLQSVSFEPLTSQILFDKVNDDVAEDKEEAKSISDTEE